MTELLEKAFTQASQLPAAAQDAFAKWVMAELRAEEKWERLFAESPDVLDKLAAEAVAEYDNGKTTPLS